MTLRWMIALVLPSLFVADAAFAQMPPEGRYALKPSWERGYIMVTDSGGFMYVDCSRVARVAGWDASHPNEPRPSALEIVYQTEDDAVVMTATAFFGGKSDARISPETLARLPSKLVGTYSARLNESVTLSGMAEFGLEPVSVQVVTAKDPEAGHPMFVSEVPSIQIELIGQNRVFFTLALHNTSSKVVTGYAICTEVKPGEPGCSSRQSRRTSPGLISAGGTLMIPYSFGHPGRDTLSGFAADPDPTTVVLKGAVFADGTIEGMGLRPLGHESVLPLTK